MFCGDRIAPHLFQAVKLPGLGQHDMYHHVHIIDEDPLLRLPAFMLIRKLTAFFFYLVLHFIGDRFEQSRVIGFTDNKEIGYGFGYLAEVEADDIFAFLFVNGMDDGFENFAVPVDPGYSVFLACFKDT